MTGLPSLSAAALSAYGSPTLALPLASASASASSPAEAGLESIGQGYGDDIAQLQSQLDPQQTPDQSTDSLSSSLEQLLQPTSDGSLGSETSLSPDEQMLRDAEPASTYSSSALLVNSGPASLPSLNLYG